MKLDSGGTPPDIPLPDLAREEPTTEIEIRTGRLALYTTVAEVVNELTAFLRSLENGTPTRAERADVERLMQLGETARECAKWDKETRSHGPSQPQHRKTVGHVGRAPRRVRRLPNGRGARSRNGDERDDTGADPARAGVRTELPGE